MQKANCKRELSYSKDIKDKMKYSINLTLFLPSLSGFPKPCGEEYNGDITFRLECSKVSHSLHIAWLWVSVFDLSYCRKNLL